MGWKNGLQLKVGVNIGMVQSVEECKTVALMILRGFYRLMSSTLSKRRIYRWQKHVAVVSCFPLDIKVDQIGGQFFQCSDILLPGGTNSDILMCFYYFRSDTSLQFFL